MMESMYQCGAKLRTFDLRVGDGKLVFEPREWLIGDAKNELILLESGMVTL